MIQVTTGLILHVQLNIIRGRVTGDHRRREEEHLALFHDFLRTHEQGTIYNVRALCHGSLLPVLQLDDERTVRGTTTTDKTITDNGCTRLNGRIGSDQAIYLIHRLDRALLRSSRWHRDRTHDRSGILTRHHTRRCGLHQEHHQYNRAGDNTEGEPFLLDEEKHLFLVFRQQGIVSGIERGVETADEGTLLLPMSLIVRFQEDRTQRRTQRQGVQSGKTDRDRHRQTELAIEDTRRTTHERYRDEHGHHDQCDGDDRTT